MALTVSFTKNNIGVPMPDCYIKVDSLFYDSIDKVIRTNIVFYVDQTQRMNDVRDKRKAIEAQIEVKKADMVSEASKSLGDSQTLNDIQTQLNDLYNQLETVTGDSPFYSKVFEFPVTGSEPDNYVTLAYTKLKTVNFTGRDDGREIELDFTKALDV